MLTPSLRKPLRNFGPIVRETAPKRTTAELSRLSTAANDLTIRGRAATAPSRVAHRAAVAMVGIHRHKLTADRLDGVGQISEGAAFPPRGRQGSSGRTGGAA
jgi:hypothetical protein